ncbi:MAG: hypothetical protein ACYC5R_05535 [Melioribacteraceae bacterium]
MKQQSNKYSLATKLDKKFIVQEQKYFSVIKERAISAYLLLL